MNQSRGTTSSSQRWSDKYKISETADGSPTLEWNETQETMHNQKGAFSETMAIYVPVFDELKNHGWPIRVCSVGFGLGYVEALLAAWSRKHQQSVDALISFEIDPDLYELFLKFCKNESISESLETVYRNVFQLVAQEFDVTIEEIQTDLLSMTSWARKGELLTEMSLESSGKNSEDKCHAIIFDPFSSKTNAELWTNSFIKEFLNIYASEKCLLSTYAATGELRRSLEEMKFEVHRPEGFAGKRQRTWAIRGNGHGEEH